MELKISINSIYYENYFTNGHLNEYFFYNMNNFIEEVINESKNFLFSRKLDRNFSPKDQKKENIFLTVKYNGGEKYFVFDADINKNIYHKILKEDGIYIYFGAYVKNSVIIFKNKYDDGINEANRNKKGTNQ